MSPPPWNGGIRVEQLGAAVEQPDAGGAVTLVAGERVEVAAERLHVDGEVGCRLRAIDQDRHAAGVGQVGDGADRVDRADGVGNVGQRQQAGARPDPGGQLVERQLAVVGDGGGDEAGALLLAQHLPGDDVRVVLQRA